MRGFPDGTMLHTHHKALQEPTRGSANLTRDSFCTKNVCSKQMLWQFSCREINEFIKQYPIGFYKSGFEMSKNHYQSHYSNQPNSAMNQSESLSIACDLFKAREHRAHKVRLVLLLIS